MEIEPSLSEGHIFMFSNIFRGLAISALCIGLTGCLTEDNYEAAAEALKGSASLREKFVVKCVGEGHDWNARSREAFSWYVSTADAKNPRLLCQRIVNSIASGKLKYKDWQSFNEDELTKGAIAALRGK